MTASNQPRQAVKLTEDIDRGGRARKIASQWRIDHKIDTVIRRSDGNNAIIAFNAFRTGDFVEVTVAIDIHTFRRNKKLTTNVMFAIQRVAKLWTRDEAKVRSLRTHSLSPLTSRS